MHALDWLNCFTQNTPTLIKPIEGVHFNRSRYRSRYRSRHRSRFRSYYQGVYVFVLVIRACVTEPLLVSAIAVLFFPFYEEILYW